MAEITGLEDVTAEDLLGIETTTGNAADPNGVNHPSHYNQHPAGVECIDIVEHMGFNLGSAVKYLWRAGLKDQEPTDKDLKKAVWYIEREIARRTVAEGPVPVAGQ